MNIHTDISQINLEQWQQLVDNSANASYFQTFACYNFFASLSFMEPFVYGVSENNSLVGLVCGYVISDGNILKRFFSKRAIISGGLLSDGRISEEAMIELLITTTRKLKNKAIYIEFRNYNDYSVLCPTFEKAGFSYVPHLNFHVATPNVEESLSKLSTTKRRDVKMSLKAGAVWAETQDTQDLRDYYKLLTDLYETKVKTPLFPFEFFEKLVQLPDGKLFVVKYNGQVIGGSLCAILPDRTIYEWFVCGLDGETKNVFPSTLATWVAIEYASTHNISCFDMMGAGRPDAGYGVREFKSKFGGELVEHGRFLHLSHPTLYRFGKFVIDYYRSERGISRKQIAVQNSLEIVVPKEQADFQAWDNFVLKHPNRSIFQTPAMYEIYKNTAKFQPIILIAKNKNKQVVGCLLAVIQHQYDGPLGLLTARSIVNGGPLVENNDPKIMDFILNGYNQLIKKKAIFSQFRNSFELLNFNDSFQRNGYRFESHLNYMIDLTKGKDQLWKEIYDGRRTKIKKAQNKGLWVCAFDENITDELVTDSYRIIKKVYDKADLPLADIQLIKNAVKSNSIVLFLVKYNEQTIGCRFAFKYSGKLYGWYAGSYSKYYSLFPNDLLIWETLKWGSENGYSTFDYGGAGSPNKKYGVRVFKAQTGGTLVNYGRYEGIHKPILNKFARVGFRIWQLFNRNL